MNNVISSKDARAQFAEILNQVVYSGREFVISRFDKPVAKIVPIIKDADENGETKRRKGIVERIMKIRKQLNATNLTEIVIRERDKEYRRWKR